MMSSTHATVGVSTTGAMTAILAYQFGMPTEVAAAYAIMAVTVAGGAYAFMAAVLARWQIRVPATIEEVIEPIPRRTPAANADQPAADPEIEALRKKPDPDLDIPPKPAAAAPAVPAPAAPVLAALAVGLSGLLLLSACTPTQQVALTNAAQAVGPLASAVVTTAFPEVAPVLTRAAELACAGQAVANKNGDSETSALLGAACAW